MSDLAERLGALADDNDDSDWLDVRRRARRRARLALPVAVVAAALAATAAVAAATGHWIFNSHDDRLTAQTQVVVGGRTWHAALTTDIAPQLSVCIQISTAGEVTRSTCRAGFRGTKQQPIAFPYGALRLKVPGGQIWMGMTLLFVRRVAITDANGHVLSTRTIRAPRGTKTPFRYWAIGVSATPVRSITAYDDQGLKLPAHLGF